MAGSFQRARAQSVPAEARPAADNVGEYERVIPPEQVRYLRSQLARKHHDYRRAAAYLDTLLAGDNEFYGNPRYRYERGILRIDHLNDRAGGCQDLRWVYNHDTASTAPTHPRWRHCPLPARKAPVGTAEWAAHRAAFLDSVARAAALCQAGHGDRGLPIFARLLATAEAGAYAPLIEYYQLPGHPRRAYPRLQQPNLLLVVRDARSLAYESLHDYPHAVADLDTLIQDSDHNLEQNTGWFCRRGVLLADFVHDQQHACDDLEECWRRGGSPTTPHRRPALAWLQHPGDNARLSYPAHRAAVLPVWQPDCDHQPRRLFRSGPRAWAGVGPAIPEEGQTRGLINFTRSPAPYTPASPSLRAAAG
ncbi:MAG: hypothetical protein M3Y54_19500 [Bacteroidota bacterium]|nr:hypothetical protein [Bacteroidota bacterium]